jgi:hypothetical protein
VSAQLQRAFSRLPWGVRRWVPLATGALAVVMLLVIVPLIFFGNGQAPTASPPPLKPVEAALQTPLRRIEEAMAHARMTEARVLVMQQLSQFPKSARVRYLLGTLEFVEKNYAAGLEAFGEALRLDAGLRADAALLLSVKSLLDDRRFGREALDMMVNQIGKPAGDELAEIASRDKRVEFRQRARTACEPLGCARKVDIVGSYVMDLSQGKTCAERREAVKALGQSKDRRAIEPLKRARRDKGVLGGIFGGGNDCIRKDIEAALDELGAK